LLGENGAGKSTLMNIIYGLYQPDEGEILVNGAPLTIHNPNDAIAHGIGMVHQHFMLIPVFTVAENIMLGSETTKRGFLARLSGIATLTAEYVRQIAHTTARIVDTRKTTPMLRAMEKAAVVAGGGYNHRMGLYDMVLIKENHVAAAGGILKAVKQTRKYLSEMEITANIEVEARNMEEVHEALTCDIERIMLDNMTIDEMREAVRLINHQVEVEASGGVNLANVRQIAETGVDFISVGALTHSAPAFDFSLLLDK